MFILRIYVFFSLSSRCDTDDDGNLTLHYYTSRVGLYPIVLGKNGEPIY